MNDRVTGIILSEQDYRDRDVIISVMTPTLGKISFVAAGVRKMTSRNASSVLPYTSAEFEFDYKPGKTMFRLIRAHTLKLYRKIREDLVLSAAASVLIGICDAMTIQEQPDEDPKILTELLEKGLDLLQDGSDPDLVIACYLAEMMELYGIGADVDECVQCGKAEAAVFSPAEGGFLCREHSGGAMMAKEELMRIRRIVKGGISMFDRVRDTVKPSPLDADLLMQMLEQHAGIRIKAFSFYQRLGSIV